MSNVKGGKAEGCIRIKDGNGRLAQGEDEVPKIWNDYSEDPCNIDIQEQAVVQMWL